MDKIIDFMEENIVPFSLKLRNQRHFAAIRDGVNSVSSLLIISSFSTLILATLKGFINENIINLLRSIFFGCFYFTGVFACFCIANELYKSYKKSSLQGGFVSIAIFISISSSNIIKGVFSLTYLFTAIFVAILSIELLIRIDKLQFIKIKLPSKVPLAVASTFDSFVTPILVLFLFVSFSYILNKLTSGLYIENIITTYIQTPLKSIMNSVFGAILIPLNNSVFWTLGIHGAQSINLFTDPILSVLSAENMMLAQQGATDGYNIITGSFFMAFVWHGGSGSTFGLLIAIIICGNKYRNHHKEMLSNSIWSGLFNINETVIFSAPIVLNPIFAIPFIIIPIINTVVAYISISLGFVSPCIVQSIPWITPPIISGFLVTGSLSGAILSGITLLISIIGYMPFVIFNYKGR